MPRVSNHFSSASSLRIWVRSGLHVHAFTCHICCTVITGVQHLRITSTTWTACLQVLIAASTMSAVKPHVPLRAVMAGRTTTAELHAFVRTLLVDAIRGAVRNDNGVTDIDEVSISGLLTTPRLRGLLQRAAMYASLQNGDNVMFLRSCSRSSEPLMSSNEAAVERRRCAPASFCALSLCSVTVCRATVSALRRRLCWIWSRCCSCDRPS